MKKFFIVLLAIIKRKEARELFVELVDLIKKVNEEIKTAKADGKVTKLEKRIIAKKALTESKDLIEIILKML